MDFKALVRERYNCKKFDKRKIETEKLNELFDVIRYAPSADNLQPWRIKVIPDQRTKELIMPAAMPFNQEKIITCSHLLVFCADTDLGPHWEKLEAAMKKNGLPDAEISHMAQVAKMIMGRPPEEKLARSQRDVFLAVSNAVNGAKSLGFDASLMGGFNAQKFSRLLELPSNLVPTLLVAIGYAADKPLPKMRFTKEEVFF